MKVDMLSDKVTRGHDGQINKLMAQAKIRAPQAKRLFAVGHDAWLFASQVQLLQKGQRVQGLTGTLTLDPVTNQLISSPDWFKIRRGKPVPIKLKIPEVVIQELNNLVPED
jgi:outer membrane PBP1 activator LpoA protein